jgi:hypothetical protein
MSRVEGQGMAGHALGISRRAAFPKRREPPKQKRESQHRQAPFSDDETGL